jgi:methanogenic corrinoid protein MtbC1
MIVEKNLNGTILSGGAPLTTDISELFEADGYADSAGNAVEGRLSK